MNLKADRMTIPVSQCRYTGQAGFVACLCKSDRSLFKELKVTAMAALHSATDAPSTCLNLNPIVGGILCLSVSIARITAFEIDELAQVVVCEFEHTSLHWLLPQSILLETVLKI